METQLGVSIRAGRAEHSLSSSHSGLMGFGLMQQHKFLNSECTATLPGFWDYKKRNLNSPSETITYWKSSSFAFPHSARRSKNIFTSLYPSLVFFFVFWGAYFKCAEQPPGLLLLLIHFALQSEKGFCNLAEVEKLRKEKGAGRSWFNSNGRKKTVSHPRQKHKGSKWV